MVKHGMDKEAYYLIMLELLDDKELAEIEKTVGKKPSPVKIGPKNFIPFSLEKNLEDCEIPRKLYDPEKSAWTGTISISRQK